MTTPRTARAALLLAAGAVGGGCSAGGHGGVLSAESMRPDPVILETRCRNAFYADGASETSFFLSDVDLERLLLGDVDHGVVLHIDLLWVPKSGATPMDSSAANVSIHYVVIAGGEVGVYGGAGFALPKGRAGDDTVGLALKDASLTLLESSEGFVDLLSPARLTGSLRATRNDERTRQIRQAVSQLVTNALGRSRLVLASTRLLSAAGPASRPER